MQNSKRKNRALLIVRIIVGGMFVFAGVMKLLDMPNTITLMSAMGLSSYVTWAVAIGEVLAGLGVLFGVYTKLAALGVVIIMGGAVYLTAGNPMTILFFVLGAALMKYGGGDYRLKIFG